jgi:peptidoglycan hydrolase CwlO-like protein
MNDTIILLISNALTGVAAWMVGKRKSSAETDNIVLKNLELSIGLYRELINDLKKEIESLNQKIQELESKVDKLYDENKKLKSTLKDDIKITKNFK